MPNQNLTSGQVLPGFYSLVLYSAQGAGTGPNRRALLWGYVGASATATLNQPFLPADQNEADAGCGQGSDLANDYAAAISQPESQGAEIWLMPIAAPSGGVASVYTYQVLVPGTNPSKSGTIQLWLSSRAVPAVGFTASDTATTIGDAIVAAVQQMDDSPIASISNMTGTLTVTYKHKGQTGEDFPVRAFISPSGTGVNISAGSMVIATNAAGAGSIVVSFGALTVTTAVANLDTPAQMAAKVIASFTADSYPLTAREGATTATVDFVLVDNKDVRRLAAHVVTTTGTTLNLGSGATDGTGSASSLTYNGTLGTGTPSLSAALTNLTNLDPFRSWSIPWTDTTSAGSIATHIESQSDGSISGQKQQIVTLAAVGAASVAGAIASGSSPALTATAPHYAILWAPDAAVPGRELAARMASARAALWFDFPQKNWNGFTIRGSERAPILLPPTRPSLTAQNTALRTYGLAPVVRGASGLMEVVKGRTTSLAVDRRLWAWSAEACAAFHVYDLGVRLREQFEGGSLLRYSTPRAPGLFDAASFVTAVQAAMDEWELGGNYDGAEALRDAVRAVVNTLNPNRIDIDYPESPPVDLDQVAFTGLFTSPAAA